MKKLIFGGLFLAAVGIGIIGCNKETRIEETFDDQKSSSVFSSELDVSLEEFQDILNSENSPEKAQGCCEGIKKWIKAHTGNTQRYENGAPVCFGNGGCGPCAGICFGSIMDGGDDGQITEEEFLEGIRAVVFTIDGEKGNIIIDIPQKYEEEFITGDTFVVENDEVLPSFLSKEAKLGSITVESGRYPVIKDLENQITRTIVNITVER